MLCPIALEKERHNKLGMKLKLLLCGVALLAAGCDSPQNPFDTSGEISYTYDLVPQPIPNISQAELEKIQQSQATAAAILPSGGGGAESGGH
jgi:hypothetical protein